MKKETKAKIEAAQKKLASARESTKASQAPLVSLTGSNSQSITDTFKDAISHAIQPLAAKIYKVAEAGCIGSKLQSVDEVQVNITVAPVVRIYFTDANGQKNSVILDKRFIEDGGASAYALEASLYAEAYVGVQNNLPNFADWQQNKVDIKAPEPK